MKNLNLSPCALSVFMAGILLAACGGSQGPVAPPGVNVVMQRVARTAPAVGGAFSGAYAGKTSGTVCSSGGTFFFKGTGKSSFLGGSNESGVLHANRTCAWRGGATLQSARHPSQEIFIALYEDRENVENPCEIGFTYAIHGGTGKFAHAKGSGDLTFQCSGSRYSDQWSGTIRF
jgi:hypothetical protein